MKLLTILVCTFLVMPFGVFAKSKKIKRDIASLKKDCRRISSIYVSEEADIDYIHAALDKVDDAGIKIAGTEIKAIVTRATSQKGELIKGAFLNNKTVCFVEFSDKTRMVFK